MGRQYYHAHTYYKLCTIKANTKSLAVTQMHVDPCKIILELKATYVTSQMSQKKVKKRSKNVHAVIGLLGPSDTELVSFLPINTTDEFGNVIELRVYMGGQSLVVEGVG